MNVLGAIVLCVLTLQQSAMESVNRKLKNADPRSSMARYLNYPPSASSLDAPGGHPFVPNPDFWAKDVDFSCVSPWNSAGGNHRAGTLISKRHIVFAAHFPLWKNVRILFVGQDGGVCPCSVEATKGIAGSDIMIGLLNAEVTPNIRPAKILPPDAAKYIGSGVNLPVVTFNQRDEIFLSEIYPIATNITCRAISAKRPQDERQKQFSGRIIGGDSGKPAFLLIGNQPILIYCLKCGGFGFGPAIHLHAREIQKAMDELCPGYKLETFDFSRVPPQ